MKKYKFRLLRFIIGNYGFVRNSLLMMIFVISTLTIIVSPNVETLKAAEREYVSQLQMNCREIPPDIVEINDNTKHRLFECDHNFVIVDESKFLR